MKTAVVFILLLNILDVAFSWSYADETSWAGVCTTGTRQSPINIRTKNATIDKTGEFIKGPLQYTGYETVDLTPVNNGHTLRWNVVPGSPAPTLSGGPLSGEYSLAQLHLHWLSEHAVDGNKFALEVHMVHLKTGFTEDKAVTIPDGICVIGILFEVHANSPESNYALEELFPDVPELVEITKDAKNATIVDLTRVMGKHLQSYYTYEGSLTTPNCDESVIWIVLDHYQTMSDTQYKTLSTVDVGGIDNYRNLQIGTQRVYRNAASCASLASFPGILTFMNLVYMCMTQKVFSLAHKGYCWLIKAKSQWFSNNIVKCNI